MNDQGVVSGLEAELTGILGNEHVMPCQSNLVIDGIHTQLCVEPATAQEVADVLRVANDRKLTVIPAGGFTHQGYGNVPPRADLVLRTTRLSGIVYYDAGDLTIGVRAGTRLADVQNAVAEHRQVFAVEAARASRATVGGALATASHGPRKHSTGGVREFCVGLEFVTGDGQIAKAGGRVVKNVAGYDLMKLLIGSHGTLGIITSANFRLMPAARQTATFMAEFRTIGEAVAFRERVVKSPLSPISLELISPFAEGVSGQSPKAWTVAIKAGGSDAVLARYRGELGEDLSRELRDANEAALWSSVVEFPATMLQLNQRAMLLDVHMPAASLEPALTEAEKAATAHGFIFSAVGRAAVASLTLALSPLPGDPPSVTQYVNALSAIRAACPADGAVIVRNCPSEVKKHIEPWGSAREVESMRRVKRTLDPNDVLNRGRFLP